VAAVAEWDERGDLVQDFDDDKARHNAALITLCVNLCPGLAAWALEKLRALRPDFRQDEAEIRKLAHDIGVATEEA